MSSFISKFGAVFFDFECCEFAKFRFGLRLFSHFWNVNIVFFTGRLVKPFNGLLTFFIFLACYLRSFLYKGMLLPSFIHWGKCSSFSFFLLLSRFFFFFLLLISLYLFASFLVIFFMCYETFSLTKFFVACFCFAAQFLWSLGFDITLYGDVLTEVFAFIWWLCISLIATFMQWRMPSCCYILFLQQ